MILQVVVVFVGFLGEDSLESTRGLLGFFREDPPFPYSSQIQHEMLPFFFLNSGFVLVDEVEAQLTVFLRRRHGDGPDLTVLAIRGTQDVHETGIKKKCPRALKGSYNYDQHQPNAGKYIYKYNIYNIYLEPKRPLFWFEKTSFWWQNEGQIGSR